MVVDWDSDSSGLELDRRELVLGWRLLVLSTKAARVSAPVVRHCLLTPLVLDAFWPPVPGGAQSSMLGRCEAVTLLVGGLFRRFLARSKAERPEKRILRTLSAIG